jgi:hypothetical protein
MEQQTDKLHWRDKPSSQDWLATATINRTTVSAPLVIAASEAQQRGQQWLSQQLTAAVSS